jgi:PAS domain S-box-containing protein
MIELLTRTKRKIGHGKRKDEKMNWFQEIHGKIFEMVKDAIFVSTAEGQLIDVNPSCLELFGYHSKKEVLKLDLAKDIYVNPEDRAKLLRLLEKKGSVRDYEITLKRRDGTRIVVSSSAQVIKDEKGEAIGYVGMLRDITKRKEYEQRLEEYSVRLEKEIQQRTKKLKESERRYRRLFKSSKDALYITTTEGKFIDLNQATVELFGYENKEELMQIGSTAELYLNPEDRNKMQRQMEEKGFVKNMEQELRRKDGTKIYALVTGTTMRDDGGNAIGYEGMIKDITERKRAEEAMRESEEKFRTLAEQSPNMIFINKGGKVLYANRKCQEKMGYKRKEFYSPDFDFHSLIAPESMEIVTSSFAKHMRGEDVAPYEYVLLTKDGRRIEAIINTALIRYEGERAILGTITDITERKRAEEELRNSEERYRSLVEDIDDGYFIVQDGKFVYVNQAFADLFGHTKKAMGGIEFSRLFPQEYVERLLGNDLKETEQSEHALQDEFEISSKEGEYLVLEIRSRVIEYNGRPAIAGICKDITERKKAEMALNEKVEELEKWYQLTVDREIKMTQLKNRIQELESVLTVMRKNQTQ